jgi:alkyldihydroxyacetonephosphate synthase
VSSASRRSTGCRSSPRGGGSGTQGGTFALYGGIAVDLSGMNRVLEVDESSLTVTVQAGIDGSVLEKELNGLGLTMPHYPGSHFFGATIGGSLAARGSGVVSTKYGKAEQLALQVEAVVPPGRTGVDAAGPQPRVRPGPAADPDRLGGDARHHHRGHHAPGAAARGPALPVLPVRLRAGRSRDGPADRHPPGRARRDALYDEADSAKLTSMLGLDTAGVLLIVVLDGFEDVMDLEQRRLEEVCAGRRPRPRARPGADLVGRQVRAVLQAQRARAAHHLRHHRHLRPLRRAARPLRGQEAHHRGGLRAYGARYTRTSRTGTRGAG